MLVRDARPDALLGRLGRKHQFCLGRSRSVGNRRWVLTIRSILVSISLLSSGLSCAAQSPQQEQGLKELGQAFQNLWSLRVSFDTKPVEFSIAGVAYRVPRNYIVTMDNWSGGPQGIVSLQVSLPDLKPISPGNAACFKPDPAKRPAGCEPLLVRMDAPGPVTADLAFERFSDLYRNKKPLPGPDGFDMYFFGSDEVRSEDYRGSQDGRTVLFSCTILNADRQHSQCSPTGDTVASGTDLGFWFAFPELSLVIKSDPGLRRLVESFAVKSPGAGK